MYSCRRCSFSGGRENFISKSTGEICKTCLRCRDKAKAYDLKRKESRKKYRKIYESTDEFKAKKKDQSKRYYLKNKDKILKKNKEYHEKIADVRKQYLSDWRKNNKHKMREYYHRRRALLNMCNGSVSSEEIQQLFLENQNCSYCGDNRNLSIDHIVPVSRGGDNSIENLTVACKSCNSSKGSKLLDEWSR